MSASPDLSDDASTDGPHAVILWMLVVGLTAWGLAWGCALLPSRAKPLLILPILVGGAVALAAVPLARLLGIRRTAAAGAYVVLLAMAGYGYSTWQSWRTSAAAARRAMPTADQRIAMEMLKQTAPDDPEMLQRYEAQLVKDEITWQEFIARRLRPLGDWRRPWPTIYFTGELALAGGAAAAATRRLWSNSRKMPGPRDQDGSHS